MNIKKIQKRLNSSFDGKVTASYRDNSIVLEGELSSWDDIVKACYTAAKRYSKTHVVNDIKFTGAEIPKMRVPDFSDKSLEGSFWDVLIIGGGISGASIARELSKWELDVLLADKEPDLALQASGRNDGEIHPGVDLSKGSLKHRYVLLGNKMYESVCKELSVPFERRGQYVGFTQRWTFPFVVLYALKKKYIDDVTDTKIISRKKLIAAEGKINPNFKFALFNSSAACVCPYGITIAYAENAVSNGVKVSLGTAVTGMVVEDENIVSVSTNRGTIYPKLVINAAGVFSEDVAKMAGDRFFSIHPRKGTDSILDKKAGVLLNSIAAIKETALKRSHTKGGGVLHTVHGNLLIGPDALETYKKEDTATEPSSISKVFAKQKRTVPALTERDIITYFAGVRAPTFEEDFIIEAGRKTKNIIHCAGIQSPGLTCAPAIALDIEAKALEMLKKDGLVINENKSFNPIRKAIPALKEMAPKEREELIKKNPDYGVIVCRCEEISKGEILDALSSPISVPTVDGVKKRVRPGMGRCQGGFCMPLVIQIIADYLNIPMDEVKKSYDNSSVLFGDIKEKSKELL